MVHTTRVYDQESFAWPSDAAAFLVQRLRRVSEWVAEWVAEWFAEWVAGGACMCVFAGDVCVHMCVCVCARVCMHVYVCVYVCTCVCVCLFVCMHACSADHRCAPGAGDPRDAAVTTAPRKEPTAAAPGRRRAPAASRSGLVGPSVSL